MRLSAAATVAAVAVLAAVAGAARAQTPGTFPLSQCLDLGLDDPFWNPEGGVYKYLSEGEGAARLATIGVTVSATSATGKVIVFPTGTPTGGDVDLGAPNALCGVDVVPGASPYCFAETQPGDALTGAPLTLYGTFEGHANNEVPYVNCSETFCPGNGCGGGRWLATPGTRNEDNDECEFELTAQRVLLRDGTVLDIECPVYNPNALCVPQGNVMVIQELGATEPDDEFRGGTIRLDFERPVALFSMSVVDIDFDTEAAQVRVYDEADTLLEEVGLADPGNNGFDSNFFNDVGVRRIDIRFTGSGSVNDIRWCVANSEVETVPEWKRTCEWDIVKSVAPASHHLLIGGAETSDYTVDVTKECTDEYRFCSSVRTSSPSPRAPVEVENLCLHADPSVVATSDWKYSTNITVSDDCECRRSSTDSEDFGACDMNPDGTVTLYNECNDVQQCEIRCSACLDLDDDETLSSAWDFTASDSSSIGSFKVVDTVSFDGVDADTTDNEAVVSDSEGAFDTFTTDAPVTLTFDREYACSEKGQPDQTFDCTATVTGKDTGAAKDSSVSVQLQCEEPTVTKDASTTFRRCYDWSIDKSASSPNEGPAGEPDCTEITFGDSLSSETVTYNFKVTATPREDTFVVEGAIELTNPHPTLDVVGATVSDSFAGTDIAVDCAGTGAAVVTIPAAGTATCTYSHTFDSRPLDGLNTVTLSYAGFEFQGTARVEFGRIPSSTCDTEAAAVDVFEGESPVPIGTFTASKATEETFRGTPVERTFEVVECDEGENGERITEYHNTATVNWASGSASDSWKVRTRSPCDYCPCEYEDWPEYSDDDDFCVEISAPKEGACLCWRSMK